MPIISRFLHVLGRCAKTSESRAAGGSQEARDEIFGPEEDHEGCEEAFPRRYNSDSPFLGLPLDQLQRLPGADSLDKRGRGGAWRCAYVE